MTGMKKSKRLSPEEKVIENESRSKERDLSREDLDQVAGGKKATKKKATKKTTRKKAVRKIDY